MLGFNAILLLFGLIFGLVPPPHKNSFAAWLGAQWVALERDGGDFSRWGPTGGS